MCAWQAVTTLYPMEGKQYLERRRKDLQLIAQTFSSKNDKLLEKVHQPESLPIIISYAMY